MIIVILSCIILFIAIILTILSLGSEWEPFGISKDKIVVVGELISGLVAIAIIIYYFWHCN